tara:strand:- start:1183 stop:1644 length:462 start_codon:yes stop_codon:yes gene_type:complete
MHVDIREATEFDLVMMLDAIEGIIDETRYELTFNREHARDHLRYYVSGTPGWIALLAETESEVVGGVLMAESLEFHDMPLLYVTKFWVLPSGRRTRAARSLLEAVVDYAREKNCTHIFATATAGLDEREQRLFVNLLTKSGFRDTGPVMMKEI